MTETEIQAACMQWLSYKGIFHFRVNNTGIFDPVKKIYRSFHGTKGAPDCICVISGVLIGLEFKTEKGRLSKHQKDFSQKLLEAGGYYVVVRSVAELEEDIRTIQEELSVKAT